MPFCLICLYTFQQNKGCYKIYIMLIQGISNTNRDGLLIKKYTDLIKQGILQDEILVIMLNPYKKKLFTEILEKNGINASEKSKIYTLNGLYYNTFKDNEQYIKSLIRSDSDDKLNQCGLEVSQYIFKQSIKEADFSDYISKVNLLHQLFRRYSLIVQNALTDKEVEERSEILKEVFALDAFKAIKSYKQKTIEYKSFDYLRQAAIFPVIYKNTKYFANIKYLIADDADEMPYMFWQFIDYIKPYLADIMIAYDDKGSSRCGYLCAYKKGASEFKEKYNPDELIVKDRGLYSEAAEKIFKIIKNGEKINISDIFGCYKSSTNRLEMLEDVFFDIKTLIQNGVVPSDIAIISPFDAEVILRSANIPGVKFQSLSGSAKLSDIPSIKHIFSILKIINGMEINDFEIKSLFINLLKIPYKKCHDVIKDFKRTKIKDYKFEDDLYNSKYNKMKSVISSLNKTRYKLSEQIKIIYENLIKEYIDFENDSKYDFLLKEAVNFEYAFEGRIQDFIQEFIIQMENSVISENPINAFNIENDKIIISSAQKLIDFSVHTKYQFWIDISNSEWVKQDTGTLYNAWVFNRDWNKKEYTLSDNIELTNDKTARMARKLILLAQKEIRFYSSMYDSEGNENFGGLTEFISFSEEKKNGFDIIPREDQKPVLEYNKGKLGVMAVPGAGKTTILLALIIKLINSGINPENIFVLTYMESAAKNFKERIKDTMPDGSVLPNISTIHGLALRIIKENGNYIKVGLDEDFEVCDDSEKEKIIKELFYQLKINEDKYDNYLRCISIVKPFADMKKLYSKYVEIQEFYNFLNEYNNILKQRNLIDYDDMLRFALWILNNNKEIREYYQNMCRYIIEDEAQDSTQVQQELINILSAKNKNVVRCGDINQSITSTFTNSNLESFKNFIRDNKKVEMNSSQRCAVPIYNLANKMIDNAILEDNKKNAFYKISMKGTGSNPETDILPKYEIFENEKEEKSFILEKIKELHRKKPDSSIAILLRLNVDVIKYNDYMQSNGIETAIRTDSLSQKEIYQYIYAVLNIVEYPLKNDNILKLALLYYARTAKSGKEKVKEFFDNLKNPFIEINSDEIEDETLLQLYWDIDYWLNKADKDIDDLALDIGLYYSKDSVDKSNTYLIATFIRRLKDSNRETDILKIIEYYAQRPMSAYRFFEENNKEDNCRVNIMTMHKSKGDEFDYVFIPQLNEEIYSVEKEDVKLKTGSHFIETVRNSIQKGAIKSPDELKNEQIQETLRLLYVGFTRARYGLFLSSAKQYVTRKNIKVSNFVASLFND